MYVHHRAQVSYTTAQNSSDNFRSYPPDDHHSPDDVYWRGGGSKGMGNGAPVRVQGQDPQKPQTAVTKIVVFERSIKIPISFH